MTTDEIQLLERALREQGVTIDGGLTPQQVREIEEDFGFTFPPDVADLLQSFVPQREDFPNWHKAHARDLIEWFDYPSDGIAFDVEENGFWLQAWGPRPDDVDDAVEEAIRRVAEAPILVPLYGRHFIPSRPAKAGNPVFSVNQSQVAIVAADLREFFETEFGVEFRGRRKPEVRTIEFWSELARS